jgi:predicted transcriptional regulator
MLGNVASLRRDVARWILEHEPCAEWQVEAALGLLHQTASARVYELHEAGLIVRRGKSRTPTGRPCHLYLTTPMLRAVLAIDDEVIA